MKNEINQRQEVKMKKTDLKKLPKLEVLAYDQRLYTNILEPEAASKITLISYERLVELAKAGFAPCLWIDGTGPFFRAQELLKWTKENLVFLQSGKPLELNLSVISPEPADLSELPMSIAQMASRMKRYPFNESMAAVYFLVEAGEVVYVGQSRKLGSRIAAHSNEKSFDKVFYIPLPPEALNEVEAALIRTLRPKLNGTCQRSSDDKDRARITEFCENASMGA